MKKIFFFFVIFCVFNSHAQVGIGTDNPHDSSILDLNPSGNDKGLLIPRLSQGQRDAITSPANGLLIFQTDNTEGFYFYSSTTSTWIKLSLVPEVNTNTQNITSNTLSITTNNGLIDSNALSITANINNIAVNTASITANMTSGTVSITSNTAAIEANTASITNSVPYSGATSSIDIGTNSLTIGGNLKGESGSIFGFDASLISLTGTTYTLSASDNGKVITIDNSSAITLTIPDALGDGFNCLIVQKGSGQIQFSVTGSLINRFSHTKTAGQYAVVSLVNIGGNTYILGGDTSN